eukprot:1726334-Prorocentrum_lima.AAC.1
MHGTGVYMKGLRTTQDHDRATQTCAALLGMQDRRAGAMGEVGTASRASHTPGFKRGIIDGK